MSNSDPLTESLLQRVRSRMSVASFGRAFYVAGLAALATALFAVLVIRLLGVVPREQERLWWLVAVPALAAAGAWIFHRRVRIDNAARQIDRFAGTNDLFLTWASLRNSAGEYQPLVRSSAEATAGRVRADDVVEYSFTERFGHIAAGAVALALAIWLVPQMDPFGRVEAAEVQAQQQKELTAIRKTNEERRKVLRKKSERSEERSEAIETQLAELRRDFRQMKPTKKEANSKVLSEHGQSLSEQWKALSSDEMRRMLGQPVPNQAVGGSRTQKMNEWLKELQDGKTKSLQDELKAAQETMRAMAEARDPEERRKLASKLKQQLQDVKKFASEKAGSKELEAAVSKALKALEAAQKKSGDPQQSQNADEMTQEAMEALKESLEISQEEIEQLAETAKDLKKLEEALKTLQQAQQLNEQQPLDGAEAGECESMEDYAEFYKQMMAQGMDGSGESNFSGRGIGEGGEAPEDDSDPEGYKEEKEKPQIRAGKVLLAIKSREYAEENDFDPDTARQYEEGLRTLKDSVQSAIETEEVPPGYVDGIKGYFDRIEEAAPAAPAQSPAPSQPTAGQP